MFDGNERIFPMKLRLFPLFPVFAACFLTGCLSVPAAKDPFAASLSPSPDTCMARAMAPWVERGQLPGAVSIVCDGDRTETSCVGFADVAAGRPITLDDAFMQCSQTKGFCGVTAAILVEEGKLSV